PSSAPQGFDQEVPAEASRDDDERQRVVPREPGWLAAGDRRIRPRAGVAANALADATPEFDKRGGGVEVLDDELTAVHLTTCRNRTPTHVEVQCPHQV